MSKLKAKWLEGSVGTPDFKEEVPTGTVDGVNTAFTLSASCTEMLSLTLNGRPLKLTDDFTVAGTALTLVSPPAIGQELYAIYY